MDIEGESRDLARSISRNDSTSGLHAALTGTISTWSLYFPVPIVCAICIYYGVPYFKDANETFRSYLHAWQLVYGHPFDYAFLTVGGLPGWLHAYTHNPNFPRYVHALFLLVGIKDITIQTAVISTCCTAATIAFIYKTFERPTAFWLVTFTFLDWVGFQYFTNTYRAWSFVLFWGCLWAMRRRWTAFAAFFILFQYEYGFAAFAAVTALIFHDGWRERRYAVAGAILSLVVFGVQVVSYLGWNAALSEVMVTLQRRAALSVWNSQIPYRLYVWPIAAVAVIAIGRSGLGQLYGAMICGGFCAFLVLHEYVVDAFMNFGLPFLTFFVVVGFALLAQRLGRFAPILALPLFFNSIANLQAFPPIPRGYIEAVRSAPGPVGSDGPLFAIAFAIKPLAGNPTNEYELCLDRPWEGTLCGAPYRIDPLE